MHIICCHTGYVQANCWGALSKYAPDTEFYDVTSDERAYGRTIADKWNRGDTLVLIEPDNEITSEVLPSFAACNEPWCTYSYPVFAPPWTRQCDTGLGCVKFSISLQQDFSFRYYLLEKTCKECGELHDFWGALDFRLNFYLRDRGIEPHIHGEIKHYHPYQAIDSDATEGPRAGAVIFKGSIRNLGRPYDNLAQTFRGGNNKVAG